MRFVISVLALLLVLAVLAAGWLLLGACGLRLPMIGTVTGGCTPQAVLERRADLALAQAANVDLAAQIAGLERELALLPCVADPPPPPPPPPEPETPSGLAPDAFDEGDISVMEGCWELSSRYDVRDIRTGQVTRFRYWQICFDAQGNGREVMRATDGTRCRGQLSGQLSGGRLTMREPGNLQCDSGAEIFRRDITCGLDASGTANCDTFQPEINGRGRATLRRAER